MTGRRRPLRDRSHCGHPRRKFLGFPYAHLRSEDRRVPMAPAGRLSEQHPQSRIDPIAKKIAARSRCPTCPASRITTTPPGISVSRPKLDAKLNWVATDKLNISGRMGWLNYTMCDRPSSACGGSPWRAQADAPVTPTGTSTAPLTARPTPSARPLLSTVISAGPSQRPTTTPYGPDRFGTSLGLPGTNAPFPSRAAGPTSIAATPTSEPRAVPHSSLQGHPVRVHRQRQLGKAYPSLRFGVDISRYSLNHFEASSADGGQFTFNGGDTTLKGGPSPNQFNSFASLLLGLTSRAV